MRVKEGTKTENEIKALAGRSTAPFTLELSGYGKNHNEILAKSKRTQVECSENVLPKKKNIYIYHIYAYIYVYMYGKTEHETKSV